MSVISCDVVIIGAGAAGLAAATAAARGGRVLVLEARKRVGGRIHTIRPRNSPRPIELGAEFIHGRPESIWKLLEEAKLLAFDASDRFDVPRIGRLAEDPKYWQHIEEVHKRLKKLSDDPKADLCWGDFLRLHCRDLPTEATAAATEYVEGFNATDRDRVSALSLRRAQQAAEKAGVDVDEAYRHVGGYNELVEHMHKKALAAGDVKVRLGVAAKAIRWLCRGVDVEARSTTKKREQFRITARCAIVTLPIGVLRAAVDDPGAIEFDPQLPASHARAIASLRSGPVIRVVFLCATRFWEKIGHDELSFIHDSNTPFPTAWTTMPLRTPLLTCWAAGRAVAPLAEKNEDELIDDAKKSLCQMLKIPRSKLEKQIVAAHIADWQKDPFARGAYSYVAVGGVGSADALAKPVGKSLIFAGEACHPYMSGTVAGAYESGLRAGRWAARTIARR